MAGRWGCGSFAVAKIPCIIGHGAGHRWCFVGELGCCSDTSRVVSESHFWRFKNSHWTGLWITAAKFRFHHQLHRLAAWGIENVLGVGIIAIAIGMIKKPFTSDGPCRDGTVVLEGECAAIAPPTQHIEGGLGNHKLIHFLGFRGFAASDISLKGHCVGSCRPVVEGNIGGVIEHKALAITKIPVHFGCSWRGLIDEFHAFSNTGILSGERGLGNGIHHHHKGFFVFKTIGIGGTSQFDCVVTGLFENEFPIHEVWGIVGIPGTVVPPSFHIARFVFGGVHEFHSIPDTHFGWNGKIGGNCWVYEYLSFEHGITTIAYIRYFKQQGNQTIFEWYITGFELHFEVRGGGRRREGCTRHGATAGWNRRNTCIPFRCCTRPVLDIGVGPGRPNIIYHRHIHHRYIQRLTPLIHWIIPRLGLGWKLIKPSARGSFHKRFERNGIVLSIVIKPLHKQLDNRISRCWNFQRDSKIHLQWILGHNAVAHQLPGHNSIQGIGHIKLVRSIRIIVFYCNIQLALIPRTNLRRNAECGFHRCQIHDTLCASSIRFIRCAFCTRYIHVVADHRRNIVLIFENCRAKIVFGHIHPTWISKILTTARSSARFIIWPRGIIIRFHTPLFTPRKIHVTCVVVQLFHLGRRPHIDSVTKIITPNVKHIAYKCHFRLILQIIS